MGKSKDKTRREETPLAMADDDPLLAMDDVDFGRILTEYPDATGADFVAIVKMVNLLEKL